MTDYFKANPDHGFQMLSYKDGALNEILNIFAKMIPLISGNLPKNVL